MKTISNKRIKYIRRLEVYIAVCFFLAMASLLGTVWIGSNPFGPPLEWREISVSRFEACWNLIFITLGFLILMSAIMEEYRDICGEVEVAPVEKKVFSNKN